MKISRFVLVLALAFGFSVQGSAQELKNSQPDPKTKLELFQAKTGIVVIKGYANIGTVSTRLGSVEIAAIELKDAANGSRSAGVRLDIKEVGRFEKEHSSFIDYDEIDSLVKGIDYVSKASGSVTGLPNFEVGYRTRGELSITTFNSGVIVNAVITSGGIGAASAYISVDELQKVRQLVLDAKAKLDSVK